MDYKYIADNYAGSHEMNTAYLRIRRYDGTFLSEHCLVLAINTLMQSASGFVSYAADIYELMRREPDDMADSVVNIMHAAEREYGRHAVMHKPTDEYRNDLLNTLAARVNVVFALNGVLYKDNVNKHTMCT
jgi:hypothetical protein